MLHGVFVHEADVEVHEVFFFVLVSHNVYPAHVGRLSKGEFEIVAYGIAVSAATLITFVISIEAVRSPET
jgi:hypothetical protein